MRLPCTIQLGGYNGNQTGPFGRINHTWTKQIRDFQRVGFERGDDKRGHSKQRHSKQRHSKRSSDDRRDDQNDEGRE